jgi:predicted dehydrogenase/nucleoside-diphosphate-sugar epimerase
MNLRVAFIGAGQMARQHFRTVGRLDVPATVVGVHDASPGHADGFARLAATRAFDSMHALLAEARPDIVHVCTPPGAHFEPARAALEAGAHVYVEKPFALTLADAQRLLDIAGSRGRLVCAGHQLLRDRAFERMMSRAAHLGTLVQADSHFAFSPAGASAILGDPLTLGKQLIDILPHPLYSLMWVMETLAPPDDPIRLSWAEAGPADVQAILRAGRLTGRLSVSLRARPVASALTLTGTSGSLSCDFVRSIVVGAANPGTEALEKILNPMAEGAQLITRTGLSLAQRARSGSSYSGLAELIGAFYRAVASGGAPPVPPGHLLRVTELFEDLAARIELSAQGPQMPDLARRRPSGEPSNASIPLTVVTGAGGFLGAAVVKALPRVRGLGRSPAPGNAGVEEWVRADLSAGVPAGALAGADVVVHAAAETAGDGEAHQRNTIEGTRQLLRAMQAAGVRRLVLVSSLSVLAPPRTPWERQDEDTPRPADPRSLGPYTWGKCRQEELVEREADALGIATRIIRPGALVDWRHPALPGLMGRRLFGRWHLGLGRPALPIAVCDVERCARAIAWTAGHFDAAPRVVNLFDPAVPTRAAFVNQLRARGWGGRIVWIPISAVAAGLTAARFVVSIGRGRWPEPLAAWAILRPRRYDPRRAAQLLDAAGTGLDAVAGSSVMSLAGR